MKVVDFGSQMCRIGIVHNVNHWEPMETTNENTINKVATSIRLDSDVDAVITQLADKESRPSRANTIEWLIKTHPRVQELLPTGEAVTAA